MAIQHSLKLDDDQTSPFYGDIAVVNNNWVFTSPGLEDTQQALQCNYRTFLGEWFLSTDLGVPWFQKVLKKNPEFQIIQSVLKVVGLDTNGVLDITDFQFDFIAAQRHFRLDAEFRCDDGSGTGLASVVQIIEV